MEGSPHLEIPEGISVVPTVGKWYLGAHFTECFPNYSLHFVDGIGQIDGEILEILWWPIDKIAAIIQAMSKAHRQKVLDDNMCQGYCLMTHWCSEDCGEQVGRG